jgi:hypothetical protein
LPTNSAWISIRPSAEPKFAAASMEFWISVSILPERVVRAGVGGHVDVVQTEQAAGCRAASIVVDRERDLTGPAVVHQHVPGAATGIPDLRRHIGNVAGVDGRLQAARHILHRFAFARDVLEVLRAHGRAETVARGHGRCGQHHALGPPVDDGRAGLRRGDIRAFAGVGRCDGVGRRRSTTRKRCVHRMIHVAQDHVRAGAGDAMSGRSGLPLSAVRMLFAVASASAPTAIPVIGLRPDGHVDRSCAGRPDRDGQRHLVVLTCGVDFRYTGDDRGRALGAVAP